jgi:hypothetical protein
VAKPHYGYRHRKRRLLLLADEPECWWCGAWPATVADHQPPIALHDHDYYRAGCCDLVPSCAACSQRQGVELARELAASRRPPPPPPPRPVPRIW